MRSRGDFLEGLLDLHRYDDRSARRSVFRQSMASLAIATSLEGPGPLDGLSPDALLRSLRVALADGLFDDLSWLAPPAAAAAVYEITGALPLGPERRDLGRRVIGWLYEGDAATFVALATRMALGSARALSGLGVRARIALAVQLGSTVDVPVDPLALAIVSRRDLARDWIGNASTGSLPERRLAARLFERAVREAVRRRSQGDEHAARLFRNLLGQEGPTGPRSQGASDTLAQAYPLLLADRETLVWRHVAAARGLLAGTLPEVSEQIRRMLSPDLSPTEWRRAATSLAASIAASPQKNLAFCREILDGPLLKADPGIATAMVWGLPRAADAEPEAAEALLDAIAAAYPIAVAEAVVDLRADLGESFGKRAAATCAQALAQSLASPQGDDGLTALGQSILRDLEGREGSELGAAVHAAVTAFVERGTRDAHALAASALEVAGSMLDAVEALESGDEDTARASMSRRAAGRLLRDLDVHLYESAILPSLLLLDRRAGAENSAVPALDSLDDRITRWLLRIEAGHPGGGAPPHATFHQRNLRLLLHVVDGQATDISEDQEGRTRARRTLVGACEVLLRRLSAEPRSPLRRAIAATVARAFDALVRIGAADAADVVLYAGSRVPDRATTEVLAEASVHPDVRQLLESYARFARAIDTPMEGRPEEPMDAALAALDALVADLPAGASQRTEALRATLSRLARGLEAVRNARALRPLADRAAKDGSPLTALEEALSGLMRLTAGARRRFGEGDEEGPSSTFFPGGNSLALAAGLGREPGAASAQELQTAIERVVETSGANLPRALSTVVARVLPRLSLLPPERVSTGRGGSEPDAVLPTAEAPLPAWLPPRRVLGGFYVHRRLGGGAVGTVFVVTRAEERHDPHAERFALKVPDYDATAARSVSESEFLKLFREEAGALLSLPDHPNLPRFVTFDAGARPKPILVMELIEGVRCDQLLATRGLAAPMALALLDGVLSGLEAMHSVRVGHLDIKPSNVVLRGGRDPVLVDFGLAGRHIRPGCATASYGAPEVWGVVPEGTRATPLTADIYSFGCFAYEVLTGDTLFEAPTDVALISSHLTHDGMPPKVRKLASGRLQSLAMFLFYCLRHNPQDRLTASALRAELRRIGPELSRMRWPLGAEAGAGVSTTRSS